MGDRSDTTMQLTTLEDRSSLHGSSGLSSARQWETPKSEPEFTHRAY